MLELSRTLGAKLGLDIEDIADSPSVLDFVYTAWLSLALLAIRLACERVFIPIISWILKSVNHSAHKKAADIFDDAYIAIWSGLLEALAVYTTLYYNGGCTPWSTDPCMIGWPHSHPVNIMQRLYFIVTFHYYLSEMISTALGVGTVLKKDMVFHHIATMALISCSYSVNLLRFGTMWMTLFDASNPLLHLAKVVHVAQVPVLKDIMLPIFALFFFVVRVACAPFSIMWPALTQSIYILPTSWSFLFVGLMMFVCILQVFWFYKIIQIARKGDKSSKPKAE